MAIDPGEPQHLRVVLDARMSNGLSGGVQQWVIGLANALSQLGEDTEEYLFLADAGHGGWLTPYLAGPCRLLIEPTATLKSRRRIGLLDPARRLRGSVFRWFPRLRTIYRRLRGTERVRWLSRADRTIQEAGADVMHFTMQSAFPTSLPSIYQPWDLQHVHLPEFFTVDQLAGRDRAYRTFCEQASLVVVATRWVKDDVSMQFAIPSERVAIVNPPPVTPAYVPPTPAQEAEIVGRLGLPPRYVFYPAQTWGHKNHERLFDALRRLRDRGIEVPLVCSGHQNQRFPALLNRAKEFGIERQIMFLGFLDTTAIQVVYRRATALIFPSLYEGWGLPILEAFDADLPVACSWVTSLPDLVGDAALLFDPLEPADIASAIERLWVDEDLRAELVKRGRVRISRFDWHQTALTMRAHYRQVAGRPLDAEDERLLATDPVV